MNCAFHPTAIDKYLDAKKIEKHLEKKEVPKAPKVVKKMPETKPLLTSVKIKPKADAKVEKEKKVLRSSIHDLKGELEKLKKELGKK